MAENCSVLDTWTYCPYACISEVVFAGENDALTKALQISLLSSSSAPAIAIPSPESLSGVTSSLLLAPPGDPLRRRDTPAGRVAKKRKSRASKRSHTTYITADPANFRELVQRVTGTQSADAAELPVDPTAGHEHPSAAAVMHGSSLLPTLDSPALFLSRSGLVGLAMDASVGRAVDGPIVAEFDPFFPVPSYPTLDSWTAM